MDDKCPKCGNKHGDLLDFLTEYGQLNFTELADKISCLQHQHNQLLNKTKADAEQITALMAVVRDAHDRLTDTEEKVEHLTNLLDDACELLQEWCNRYPGDSYMIEKTDNFGSVGD